LRKTEYPLVSIIIPVYNSEKYLAECIESVIAQTWSNKEIIIVDDGSVDNSYEIATKYSIHSYIKIISQKNKGASAARNVGLNEANGDYIQFLDADDLLGRDKIEEQMKLLLKHPGKVAVCQTVHFYSDQNPYDCLPSPYESSFLYDTDDAVEFLINLYGGQNNHGSMITIHSWLVPKILISKIGQWNEDLSLDDDTEFFCRAVISSDGIVYANACYNYYRKHKSSNSLSSLKAKGALHAKFKAFLLIKQYLLNATDNIKAKKALAHSAIELAVSAYPADKKLAFEILKTIEELGGTNYVPVLGGRGIEMIKKTFGWKTARQLQHIKELLN
jgi:glycosyltransferase involved in cell wall biosynthesis